VVREGGARRQSAKAEREGRARRQSAKAEREGRARRQSAKVVRVIRSTTGKWGSPARAGAVAA
jgi:hypothetical protein